MELQNIKLIIWDLDETFWQGTISEEKIVFIPEHISFVKDTTDMGIVNSICSKNDFNVAKNSLESAGIWEYFVFSSIDWSSKGCRIKNIISTMKLRPVNVLFIDDNVQNLEEAKHFCPGLITAFPQDISSAIKEARISPKNDLQHRRLNQYKQLEKKEAKRAEFSSNDEFLMSCNIKAEICYDCETQTDRIHELILRSNQLNYTKFRQDKDELDKLIDDKDIKTGYVRVNDKFGDYGIVGFFALRDSRLIHFVFSCRTLGMRIEQYVYSKLGYPDLDVVGEVASELNKTEAPEWINKKDNVISENNINPSATKRVLFKGPCDMSQMYAFLNLRQKAVTEFTYMNDDGISIEGHNHTAQIVTSLYATDERKKEIVDDADFFDKNMLSTALQTEKFDFVVLSMLTDGNLGVYRRRETGECIALCEKKYNLNDPTNRKKYINKEIFTSFIDFTEEKLKVFEEKYLFEDFNVGMTVDNLQKILQFVGEDTKLILLLGSEKEFKKKCKESYYNRHKEHAEMNAGIMAWAKDKPNVIVLPFDKYIKGDADFVDTINHFVKRVYYDLARELAAIFSDSTEKCEIKGKSVLLKETVKQKLRILKSKVITRIK